MAKVKLGDKISFPLELSVDDLLNMDGMSSGELPHEGSWQDLDCNSPEKLGPASSRLYKLMAILIHKGTSASHGHYGAEHSENLHLHNFDLLFAV